MKRFFSLFAVIFFVLSSHAQDNQESQTISLENKESRFLSKAQWSSDFLMGGGQFSEGQDESQFVQLLLRPKAQVQWTDDFSVRGELWVSLNSARTQSRFQNPNFNTLNLMELVAAYKPANWFQAEIGAINQKHLRNRMLVADRAFPGAMLASAWESKSLYLKGKIQHVVPTSTSLEMDRTKAEPLPRLQTEGVEVKWTPKKWFQAEADINHFAFTKLPSIVAYQSGRLGNQVIGTDPSESFFAYQYDGISQSYGFDFLYTSFIGQGFDIGIIDNNSAPSDRQRSQYIGTELKIFLDDINIMPKYGQFFAESDSVPAVYSAFEFGRNNRDGRLYGLKIDFKKLGFNVSSSYVESQVIQPNGVQFAMDYLELVLEVEDVTL